MQLLLRRFQFLTSCVLGFLLSVYAPTPVFAQVAPAPDPASILWSCTFPTSFTSCGFSEQALVPGRATIVDMGRDGPTSVRLHTEPGDSNVFGSGTSERDDLELADSASACTQGQEAWWAHSVLFPDDYVQVPESTGSAWNFAVVADFHQTGPLGPTLWELDAMPATAISPDRPTGLQFVGHGGDPNNPVVYGAAIGPLVKNVWYDFVYHVRWSANADGFFYAWVNGEQKLSYTGPTLYTGDSCYLKLANYHSPTGQPSSVIHDRVIRGATPNAVSLEMLSGVAMIPLTPPTADTTPPTTPTGLAASTVSATQITLSWAASSDDVGVTGYRVYRNGALLITLGAVTTLQNTGLSPSTIYTYTVQAVDAAGNASGQSAAASATTPAASDTTPPSIPTGLVATAVSSSQISLSWVASTDDVGVAGYVVLRNGAPLATLGAVTSYQDAGLAPSTAYSYTVQATDAAGNSSGQSAAASAATPGLPDTTVPSTPAGLVASAVSSSQINLSWSASTDNVGVSGYRVYRGGALLVTLGALTAYQDAGLRPSTAYTYTVQAIDAAGNASAQSFAASATTPAAPDTAAPSVPTGLKGTAVSPSQVNLSWKASTDNVRVAGYTVYLNGAAHATATGTTFQHTGLMPGTTYSYRVSAFDAAGNNSASTAPVSVKTLRRRVVSGDFDGDGKSDILWRNASTGANAIWLMNGASVTSAPVFSTVADFTWGIAGVGDFDGDGKSDILWLNASGANLIWFMSGDNILSGVAVGAQADSTWSFAGIGDFDGDGKSDILWRSTATGAVAIWLMSGATVAGGTSAVATVADPAWSIAAVADFDGDGKSDILWRNSATGANLLWLMNGTSIANPVPINAMPDLAWAIAATGDFDGDGKADILWRNGTTGQNAIWFMNGPAVATSSSIWSVTDSSWSVAGTGDFDADGKSDILWRNAATGQDAIWFLNGAAVSSGPFTGTMADAGWSIAYP
ncbi:MAG TPA: FG-GAP-like repeat-containing protein [Burkholderiales bacterium]|nr:FG-GAP-like repeat-containing protein [Burkholderiales bacterium]